MNTLSQLIQAEFVVYYYYTMPRIMIDHNYPLSGSFCVGNTLPVQAHSVLEKAIY